MSASLRIRPSQFPLRWRLTLWYLLTLGIILLLFAIFLYLQLRANMLHQLDASLQLVASQIRLNDQDDRLTLQEISSRAEGAASPTAGFVIYLTAVDGTVWDKSGPAARVPLVWPLQTGISTTKIGDDFWRVINQEVSAGDVSGWIQVIGDMDPINDTLDRLLALILVGGPLALILAGLGGYFLAGRALHPIDRMTRTAQAITAGDLNRRIQYQGPDDEVGHLAQTFDTMLDRLQIAFERERQFTGDAAHELRTPLAALKGRIEVTLSHPRRPQTYVDTLQEMQEQIDRLIRLSNDLLFMARLDQGQRAPQFVPIEVHDFLGAVVDQIRPLAAAKSIALEETIPTGLILPGDIDLLIRLFLNLLDNAVKYTPKNGRVYIQAIPKNQSIHFAISDTGPGIATLHLPQLFDRFYRAESDRARSGQNNAGGGAGLGLAIAHEIARVHGGNLTVQSELGKGTTFIVLLPTKFPDSSIQF